MAHLCVQLCNLQHTPMHVYSVDSAIQLHGISSQLLSKSHVVMQRCHRYHCIHMLIYRGQAYLGQRGPMFLYIEKTQKPHSQCSTSTHFFTFSLLLFPPFLLEVNNRAGQGKYGEERTLWQSTAWIGNMGRSALLLQSKSPVRPV